MVGITPTGFSTALLCVFLSGRWLVPCCFTCEALLELGSQLTLAMLSLRTGDVCEGL